MQRFDVTQKAVADRAQVHFTHVAHVLAGRTVSRRIVCIARRLVAEARANGSRRSR